MTNRFYNPQGQFFVNPTTGAPLAGGKLFFYQSGGSTKLNTYSDQALTTPNSNPVVLDSAGQAGNIFLQNLSYRVVLAPSSDTDPPGSPIWTFDPVYTPDFNVFGHVQGVVGNPNGQLAGTAAAGTTPADMAFDTTNNIFYVCTGTGTSSTAVWTAINASAAQSSLPTPQGYLNLTGGGASATGVWPGEVIAGTTVFYTPNLGNLIPIYGGASFAITSIQAELSATLVAQHTANSIFDWFVFNLAGVPTLGSGPAWTTSTPGSSARGAGAGTTALSRLQGIWTNTNQITLRYGNGTLTTSVSANQATYVGTMHVDGTAGQCTCHRSYGQNRKWGLWNAYNRMAILLKAGDGTASWNYGTNTARASNNVPAAYAANTFNVGSGIAANGMVLLQGLAEEIYELRFIQRINANSGAGSAHGQNSIGINSVTVISGKVGNVQNQSNVSTIGDGNAQFIANAALGLTNVCCLEQSPQATNSPTYSGTETSMQLTALWRG